MIIEKTLLAACNHLPKFPVSTTLEEPTSVELEGTVGGVDNEGKPWSSNIEQMAVMDKELRKSKACYLSCLSEFGFPVQESEGTVGVSTPIQSITTVKWY